MRPLMAHLITLHDAQAHHSLIDILKLNVMMDELEDAEK